MKHTPSSRIASESTYYFAKKLAQLRERNNRLGDEKIINLGIGNPDMPPHPAVLEAMIKTLKGKNSHSYQPYRGTPRLREAFAKWYKRHHNLELNAETEVLPLLGSKEGVMHISMAFLNPGDQVLIPNPGYPAYATATRMAEGIPIEYNLSATNKWRPNLEELEKQNLSKVKLMWVNYPHMPTGAKASKTLFMDLVCFAKRNNILLCHDNPYSLILNPEPLSILQISGAKDVALELTSLSKNYSMAGFRVGAVVGSAQVIDNILRFKSNMDSGMFLPIQEAAITALTMENGWLQKMNKGYKERRERALEILNFLGCTYEIESSGLFVWAKIPDRFENSEDFSELILNKAKVFIAPGHIFGNVGKRYIRISLCSDEEVLIQSKQRILNTMSS